MNNPKTNLPLLIIFFLFQCAGFYNRPLLLENLNTNLESKIVHMEFTGFEFYEKEKNILKEEIFKSGYKESPNSEILLETILEEKNVFYKYPTLHGANFICSFFTLGIIPYYTITEHQITYRFSENGRISTGSTQILKLEQLRGLLILPFSYYYWPSVAFDKSIIDSWETQDSLK